MSNKTLTFEADMQGAFAILRQSLLMAQTQLKGIGEYRAAIKLLDKLDEISKALLVKVRLEDGTEEERIARLEATGDEVRDLLPEGGEVDLSEQEFNLLKRAFEASTDQGLWRVQVRREVDTAARILGMVEEEEK